MSISTATSGPARPDRSRSTTAKPQSSCTRTGWPASCQTHFSIGLPAHRRLEAKTILTFNTRPAETAGTAAEHHRGRRRVASSPGNTVRLTFRSLSINIANLLATGDFTSTTQNAAGLRRAERRIFWQGITYRLQNGQVNPDAIGVVVPNATVGIVKIGTTVRGHGGGHMAILGSAPIPAARTSYRQRPSASVQHHRPGGQRDDRVAGHAGRVVTVNVRVGGPSMGMAAGEVRRGKTRSASAVS